MNWFRKKTKDKTKAQLEAVRLAEWKQMADLTLTLIRTDALGNNWYEFNQISNVPVTRTLQIETAQKHAEFCIGTKELDEAIKLAKSALINPKGADIVTAVNILHELEIRRLMNLEAETLKAFAKAVFVIEGEDLRGENNDAYERRKDECFAKDPESRDFFLQRAYTALPIYQSSSNLNVAELLKTTSLIRARLSVVLAEAATKTGTTV